MRRMLLAVGATLCAVALSSCAAAVAPSAGGRHDSARPASQPARPSAAPATSATPSVVAKAAPNPCKRNRHGQLVRVSLKQQRLWMCTATTLAHQTPITSGMVGQYTHTPTGHYRIQALNRDQTLTLIDGQQYQVKYWIPFDAPLFGFHDASWQIFPFGSTKYRHHGSHGCVHMPTHAIAQLFHWAHVGTRVAIH